MNTLREIIENQLNWARLFFVQRMLERMAVGAAAEEWIGKHLRPSRQSRSVYGLKHAFSRDSGDYVRESQFSKLLVKAGVRVVGDRAYAEVV